MRHAATLDLAGGGVRRLRPAGPRCPAPGARARARARARAGAGSGEAPVTFDSAGGVGARAGHLLGPHVGRQRLARPVGRRRPSAPPLSISWATGTASRPVDPAAYDRHGSRICSTGSPPSRSMPSASRSAPGRSWCWPRPTPKRFGSLVVAGVGANLFRDDDGAGGRRIADAFDGDVDPQDPTLRYFATLAEAPDQDPRCLAALMHRPHPVPLTIEGPGPHHLPGSGRAR